jgi:pimeloyl-ACP methyl ester carboxylesterase
MTSREPRTARKKPTEREGVVSDEPQPHYALSSIDGRPIYYDVVEPSTEPAMTIVMCDGLGCDGYVWKHLRRVLAGSYRLLHWHYAGHGRSPMPLDRKRITIPGLAQDLLAVLDDAGIDRVVACGHSLGVQVVLETYRVAPARIAALILACGAPEKPLRTFRGTDRFEALLPTVQRMAQRTPWLFNRLSRRILPTRLAYEIATLIEPNEALIEPRDFMPYLESLARIDMRLFLDMLAAACQHSAGDLLAQIDVPTLIIAGDQDSFTPPELSTRMQETIPGAELLMIEGGSHTAPIERPEQVNETVHDFLRRRLDTAKSSTIQQKKLDLVANEPAATPHPAPPRPA